MQENDCNYAEQDDAGGWKCEARDLAAALAGGAIIGVPLLFTMEMWAHGMALSSWHLLGLLGAILGLNFVFDLLSGFREKYSPADALSEAVTSVAIGIVFAVFILSVIGELDWSAALHENTGKILLEALVVSVGASFANSQVRRKSRTGEDENAENQDNGQENSKKAKAPDDPNAEQWKADLRDLGSTVAGATVFALNVAPTEEILLVASRISPWQQMGLLAGSLALCWVILFASGFDENQNFTGSIAQKPWSETLFATATALVVSALLLYGLGQREVLDSPAIFVAATLTLGLPATIGGAAGRIIA